MMIFGACFLMKQDETSKQTLFPAGFWVSYGFLGGKST
jgi:hypothetical protein